jgi:uncharacterized protein DUF72
MRGCASHPYEMHSFAGNTWITLHSSITTCALPDRTVNVSPWIFRKCSSHQDVTGKPEIAPFACRRVYDLLRYNLYHGGLAELADAEVSKTSESNLISVRFRYPPPSGVFPRKSMQRVPGLSIGAEADSCKKKVEIYTFSYTVSRASELSYLYIAVCWQTQRTQNPPALAVMGVRPPLPAPKANPMVFIGTSGWAYSSWKPGFYPQALPQKRFLEYYATQLNSVEVNYTFRQLPTESMLAGWLAASSAGFRFSFKAPQRITHILRLKDCSDVSLSPYYLCSVESFSAALF